MNNDILVADAQRQVALALHLVRQSPRGTAIRANAIASAAARLYRLTSAGYRAGGVRNVIAYSRICESALLRLRTHPGRELPR